MTVYGIFFAGGSTALFGVLEYLPMKGSEGKPDVEYLIIAFLLRFAHALGHTAFITATMTLLSVRLSENAALVMVCLFTALSFFP